MIATTQQNMNAELELGSSAGPPRNWKGIGIALLVIAAVMGLVTLAIFILTPDVSGVLQHSCLTLEAVESHEFRVHMPEVSWLSDGEVSFCNSEDHILIHDLFTNLTSTLLHNRTREMRCLGMQVSPDKNFLLETSDLRPVFSQSFTASYAIYTVSTGEMLDVTPPQQNSSLLQFAAWGPQGNQLVFVFENDIYYKPDVWSTAVRLTSTGRDWMLRNGLSDWTYEEEILLKYPSLWWSRDGGRLAYLSINNSDTPYMEIPHFLGGAYPSNILYPYPKAGSRIPSVQLSVVNLYGPPHTVQMVPPDSLYSRESYISMVSWVSSTRLSVRWLNRVQNQSLLCVCEATTGSCYEKHQTTGEVWRTSQRQEAPLFSADGSVVYFIMPAKQGARGEFQHIAGVSNQALSLTAAPLFLTSGNWDVLSLCAINEEHNKIYFLSSEDSPHSRHLYSVDLGGAFERQCLTCDLFENCSIYRAEFSPNQTHLTLYCLGPGVPKVTIHSTSDLSSYTVVENNSLLSLSLQSLRVPEHFIHSFFSNGNEVDVKMFLPSASERNLLPLLVIIDTETVSERFDLSWPQVLSSQHNVAVAYVDGGMRWVSARSDTLDPRKSTFFRVKELLGVVQSLMQLQYIDDRRVALYGKGFGGFLSLKLLTASDHMFSCAAVASPITDFRIYSAAFSERILGLPLKEDHSYTAASVLEDVHKIKVKNFLLIHGTADARVHFQHSAELLSRLLKVGISHRVEIFPDQGHDLQDGRSLQHLHRSLLHFLHECLQPWDLD